MPLIPERFLRFAIRDLKAEIEHDKKNMIVPTDTSEKEFWLSRLNEYYALEHGDLEENAKVDHALFIATMAEKIQHLVIDLEEILPENFTFVGHEKGLQLREEIGLDQEDWYATVRIVFPLNTHTISSTFFKGLLGESVHKAGSVDAFFKKYIIECPPHLVDVIRMYVHRILVD